LANGSNITIASKYLIEKFAFSVTLLNSPKLFSNCCSSKITLGSFVPVIKVLTMIKIPKIIPDKNSQLYLR